MRNPRPLAGNLLIHHKLRPEIVLDQLPVQGIQSLRRQRFAPLCHGMRISFELGKHRLPVYRCLKALQILI